MVAPFPPRLLRRKGKNQIQFFLTRRDGGRSTAPTEESAISLPRWITISLPLAAAAGRAQRQRIIAEALLRMQQPDGSWELPMG